MVCRPHLCGRVRLDLVLAPKNWGSRSLVRTRDVLRKVRANIAGVSSSTTFHSTRSSTANTTATTDLNILTITTTTGTGMGTAMAIAMAMDTAMAMATAMATMRPPKDRHEADENLLQNLLVVFPDSVRSRPRVRPGARTERALKLPHSEAPASAVAPRARSAPAIFWK